MSIACPWHCYGYCGYNLQFPQLHSQQIIDDLKIFFYSTFVPNLGMTFGAVRLIHKVIQRYYVRNYIAKTYTDECPDMFDKNLPAILYLSDKLEISTVACMSHLR